MPVLHEESTMSRFTDHILIVALASGAVALDAGFQIPEALSKAVKAEWSGIHALADAHRDGVQQEELMFQRSFDIRPGGALAVDVHDADVEIQTGSESSVEVKLYLHSEDMEWARRMYERAQFQAEEQGSTIRLTSQEVRVDRRDWSRRQWYSVRARIRIPRQFDVTIRTGDGDVTVDDLDGTLDLRTADGDVAVGRVRGVVEAHTQDGDVIVGDIEGPRVSVQSQDGDLSMGALTVEEAIIETQDGDVSVESVSGDVRVQTHDGDLRIGLASVAGASIRTGDGDVTVYLPESFAADVDIQSESIEVGKAFQVIGSVSRHRIRGTMNGGGPPLTVRTSDGSVTFRPTSR
jgi:hypothetical protein